MANQAMVRGDLSRLEKKLSSWRERCGGPGRPIPAAFWAEAAAVAATAGVVPTARILRMDRERLARQLGGALSGPGPIARLVAPPERSASPGFVAVNATEVFARPRAVVRLTSRDGEQLEVEVEGGAIDVAAVARAFWERAR